MTEVQTVKDVGPTNSEEYLMRTLTHAIEIEDWQGLAGDIEAMEHIVRTYSAVLGRVKTTVLGVMEAQGVSELADGDFVLSREPAAKSVEWNETILCDEVGALLSDDEWANLVTRYDEETIVHVFKVETRKLDALAKRRGGALAEAVAHARSEVPKGNPKLAVSRRTKPQPAQRQPAPAPMEDSLDSDRW